MDRLKEEEEKELRALNEGELPKMMPNCFPAWNRKCKKEASHFFFCVESNWSKLNNKETGDLTQTILRGCKNYMESYVNCMGSNKIDEQEKKMDDLQILEEFEKMRKNLEKKEKN